MNSPRIIGIASVIVGITLLLLGLMGVLFVAEPGQYSFSTPWPALDHWLIENLSLNGVRHLGDIVLVFAGLALLFVGRRTLTTRSRADAR